MTNAVFEADSEVFEAPSSNCADEQSEMPFEEDTDSSTFVSTSTKQLFVSQKFRKHKEQTQNANFDIIQTQNTIEAELREEIGRISRRLVLANFRYESALQMASRTSFLQRELHALNERHQMTSSENAKLLNQLGQIQEFLSRLPTDRLVYMTRKTDRQIRLDVQAYTQLQPDEFIKLVQEPYNKLSVNQRLQMKLHQIILIFADELDHLRSLISALQTDHKTVCTMNRRQVNLEQSVIAHECIVPDGHKEVLEKDSDNGNSTEPGKCDRYPGTERILEKELAALRGGGNDALEQIEWLQYKLEKKEWEMEELRRKTKKLLKTGLESTRRCGKNSPNVEQKLAQAKLKILCTESLKKDALTQLDKMKKQLEESRNKLCEVESKARQHQMDLELKLRGAQEKLKAYESLEMQLDKAIEQRIYQGLRSPNQLINNTDLLDEVDQVLFIPRHSAGGITALTTLAARRVEHGLKLVSQLRQKEIEVESLKCKLEKTFREAKDARAEATRLAAITSNSGNPVDCLVNTICQQDQTIESLQMQLSEMRTSLTEQTRLREDLEKERNSLAKDLQCLLHSRQSQAQTRKEIEALLQNVARDLSA